MLKTAQPPTRFNTLRALAASVLVAVLALAGLLGGCDGWPGGSPDPDPPPQTEILAIRMDPDTVAAGDTMLIHCVIRDSLDDRFTFMWVLARAGTMLPVDGTLTGPKIRWVAPEDVRPGISRFSGGVNVDNGSTDSTIVTASVSLFVRGPASGQ